MTDRVQRTRDISNTAHSPAFPLAANAHVLGRGMAAVLLPSPTCSTAVHTYRHCWQPPSPGITQGWVLSNKAEIRASVGALDACQHCCSQQCPIQRFILHFRQLIKLAWFLCIPLWPSSFTHSNGRFTIHRREKTRENFRKGRYYNTVGKQIWKAIHLGISKGRTSIKTLLTSVGYGTLRAW